ncbi:MAG TPA: glycosyltransferase family 9 protein [Bryobacteraceae bacterium]|nr:glycosyltransferase family 9 protein [Bryobacteraceae bacterium]
MENISPDDLALELLNQCLRGNDYSSELLQTLLRMALSPDTAEAHRASHALFRTVVEKLGDLFEPCLCDCYAALFSETISRAMPALPKQELLERYRRVRMPRRMKDDAQPKRVFVLSRITLGADIAITSVVLEAAKRRFPKAEIYFVGPPKNYELFAADPHIRHLASPYLREGSLAERLGVFPRLKNALWASDAIVIDPDSRLTQLGLLPVCPEQNYYFMESRSYGGYANESLTTLTQRWLRETFGVEDAQPFVDPVSSAGPAAITVSLGVGENPAKRIGGSFERELLRQLASGGHSVLVDRGGTAEEAARVDRAIEGLPNVRTWTGPFAPFAASISHSSLYCGYDSAGQHAAAACAVPQLTIFAGAPSARFKARWKPTGPARCEIIVAGPAGPDEILSRTRSALVNLLNLNSITL